VVNHPAYKQELSMKLAMLNDLLDSKRFVLCEEFNFENFQIVLINQYKLKKHSVNTQSLYKEKSKGNFKINANNLKIKEAFISIKQTIKKYS